MTPDLIARLRDDLFAADYTAVTVESLWGADAASALRRGQREPARRAVATTTVPAGVLATVFVLGFAVPTARLEEALPAVGVDGAVELGLVRLDGDSAEPLLDLRPHAFVDALGAGSWWIASDLGEVALRRAIPENHVLGVGGASLTLAGLTVGSKADSVLDLGTGCGIQALHAARYAKRVVATDISGRALELAKLNAALNGVSTIEFRSGSLYEPVAGERFDRIVSNPPFVITPRGANVPSYEYRDGGMVGDALVQSVVAGLADHLEPGGLAQLLGNWEYSGVDGLDRVRSWAAATGLDAWVVEREVQSVEEYAETWIRDGGTRPGPEFDRLYSSWLDDFSARGVHRVGFGYLSFRRGSAPLLERVEHYGYPLGGSLGTHIREVFEAHDWLSTADLPGSTLTLAPDVTEERHYWPGADDPTVMLLRQGSGFARSIPVGTALAAVVGACDGDLSIGAICGAVAQLLEVDESALLAEILPEIRELVSTGFLLP